MLVSQPTAKERQMIIILFAKNTVYLANLFLKCMLCLLNGTVGLL